MLIVAGVAGFTPAVHLLQLIASVTGGNTDVRPTTEGPWLVMTTIGCPTGGLYRQTYPFTSSSLKL